MAIVGSLSSIATRVELKIRTSALPGLFRSLVGKLKRPGSSRTTTSISSSQELVLL